jgi:hypothetical protein
MTTDELRAIRERCEAATPGPWLHAERIRLACIYQDQGIETFDCIDDVDSFVVFVGMAHSEQSRKDFDFIADARTDIPALLAEVERLQAEVALLAAGPMP